MAPPCDGGFDGGAAPPLVGITASTITPMIIPVTFKTLTMVMPCSLNYVFSLSPRVESSFKTLFIFQFSFQIFNAARQLSHIEAAPDKSGLVLLDYWLGLKRCLVIIHN